MYNPSVNQKENYNSIYLDCALSGNFKTLLSLLRHFKLEPRADLNFYYQQENSEHKVYALSVCLQNCEYNKTAVECLIEMQKQGVDFDVFCRLVSSIENVIRVDLDCNSKPIHILEIAASLTQPKIHDLVLAQISKQRIQELLNSTSVFSIAVASNNLSLVKFFFENFDVDLNKEIIKDVQQQENSIHSMVEGPFIVNNAKTVEMLTYLIKNGASLIKQSSVGLSKTALQKITENKNVGKIFLGCATEAAMSQSLSIKVKSVNGLNSEQSKDVNTSEVDPMITSSLFTSIQQKNTDNTEALIKVIGKKNLPNIVNVNGENLLSAAISAKNFGLVKKLLSYGCSINQYDKSQSSNPLIKFLTLSHQRWEDRDPRGNRRAEIREVIFNVANFDMKNSRGESLLWNLYFTPIDLHGSDGRATKGNITKKEIIDKIVNSHPKTTDGTPDLFYKNSSGESFIEYIIKREIANPLLQSTSVQIGNLNPELSLKNILLAVGKSPDLTQEISRTIISCFFSKNGKNFWKGTGLSKLISDVKVFYSEAESLKQSKYSSCLKEIFEPIFDKASFGPQDEVVLKSLAPPDVERIKEFSAFFENKILNLLLSDPTPVLQKRPSSL